MDAGRRTRTTAIHQSAAGAGAEHAHAFVLFGGRPGVRGGHGGLRAVGGMAGGSPRAAGELGGSGQGQGQGQGLGLGLGEG